jgi:type IV fimbrial biogenesis protein FimT
LNDLTGRSYQKNSYRRDSETGFTLIEVLICTFLIGIITSTFVELFGYQLAGQQLNEVTHAFIQDAQLARQLSRQLNEKVTLQPINQEDPHNWSQGWAITRPTETSNKGVQIKTYLLNQHHLNAQVQIAEHLLNDSQQFTDMSARNKKRHIRFQNGQPALLNNGGFVANRIIWQHKNYPALIRHVILGPGGRWRICDPDNNSQKCL